jgi:hypothetical protein
MSASILIELKGVGKFYMKGKTWVTSTKTKASPVR